MKLQKFYPIMLVIAVALAGLIACAGKDAKNPTSQQTITNPPDQTAAVIIEKFEANPQTLAGPGDALVKWFVKNPVKTTVTPRLGEVSPVGEQMMHFDSTTTLVLCAWGKTAAGIDTAAYDTIVVKVVAIEKLPAIFAGTLSPAGPDSIGYSVGVHAVVSHASDQNYVLASWILSAPAHQFIETNGKRVDFGRDTSAVASQVLLSLPGIWDVSTASTFTEDNEVKLYITFAWNRRKSLNLPNPNAPDGTMAIDPAGCNQIAYTTGTGAAPQGRQVGNTSQIDWQGWSLLHLTTTVGGKVYHWGDTSRVEIYPVTITMPVGSKWRIESPQPDVPAIEVLPTSWGGVDLKVHFAW